MATIRAYTTIEQSRILADILPLESADMGWNVFVDRTTRILPMDDWDLVKDGSGNVKFYPAWSLAALLHVLPYPTLHQQRDGAWGLDAWVEQVKPYSVNNAICEVDACYEMIIKLHEQKLL